MVFPHTSLVLGLYLCSFWFIPLSALAGTGTTGGELLRFGFSARPTALGSAGRALSGELASLSLNPAALARLSTRQVLFTAQSLYEGLSYQGLAVAEPQGDGVLGFTVRRLDEGVLTGRDESGYLTGSYGAGSWNVSVAGGWALTPTFDLGLTVGYLSETIAQVTAGTPIADCGFQWRVTEGLRLGGAFTHVGLGLKFVQAVTPLPLTGSLGLAWTPWSDGPTVQVDGILPLGEAPFLNLGVEGSLASLLVVRAGYSGDPAKEVGWGVTAGVGVQFPAFGLDYAYLPAGRLGLTHQVSVVMRY